MWILDSVSLSEEVKPYSNVGYLPLAKIKTNSTDVPSVKVDYFYKQRSSPIYSYVDDPFKQRKSYKVNITGTELVTSISVPDYVRIESPTQYKEGDFIFADGTLQVLNITIGSISGDLIITKFIDSQIFTLDLPSFCTVNKITYEGLELEYNVLNRNIKINGYYEFPIKLEIYVSFDIPAPSSSEVDTVLFFDLRDTVDMFVYESKLYRKVAGSLIVNRGNLVCNGRNMLVWVDTP